MTPTQPSQAVEAAERTTALDEFTEYFVRNYPGPDTIINDPHWHAPKIFSAALHAIRAELARQQEVAPVTDKEVDDALAWCHLLAEVVTVEEMRRALTKFAASRAPVALPAPALAERLTRASNNILTGRADLNDSNACAIAAEIFSTPAPKQGDAKDARPDSFHSDSGECDRVHAPGPTDAEQIGGKEIESWYCYGMPAEPLTDDQRVEVIEFASHFEECCYSREELGAMDDESLISSAYSAMYDYARGQM